MAIRGPGVDALDRVEILSRPALREWLQAHHLQPAGVWLVTWKKRHADRHVPWDDVVAECLCFGWIDGRARALDADRSQLASPDAAAALLIDELAAILHAAPDAHERRGAVS